MCFEGFFFHDCNPDGVIDAADFGEEPHDGEVFVATDVDTDKVFGGVGGESGNLGCVGEPAPGLGVMRVGIGNFRFDI